MKKTLFIFLLFTLITPTCLSAEVKKATLYNPFTADRKVVVVGQDNVFNDGYLLETPTNNLISYWRNKINNKKSWTQEELELIPEEYFDAVVPKVISLIPKDDLLGGFEEKIITCLGKECDKYLKHEADLLGFSVASSYRTTLSSSMTSTQTTIPVSSITTKDGHVLNMGDLGSKVFFTIEPGANKEELVVCTGISGTSWTGVTRGLAFYGTSTSAVAANRKTHSAGSVIVMSNVHYVYDELVDKDTAETISGLKTYSTYPRISVSGTLPTADAEFATKVYVDTVGAGGFTSLNASTTKGLETYGTAPETVGINASTTSGLAFDDNGALYVVASSTGGIQIDSNGVAFDASDNFSFSGSNNFSSTTSLATTTVLDIDITELLDGSTTTLHNHNIGESITGLSLVASDDLIQSADTERATTSTTYYKSKEIVVSISGTYRIKFDLKVQVGVNTAYGRIYKNGVAYGTEQSEGGTSYVTYSEDLSFSNGDLMQLYFKHDSGADTAKIRNFRIYGVMIPVTNVNLN